MNWMKLWKFIKKLYLKFITDDIAALGAQVTYFLILAFFPLLAFIVTIISYTNLMTPDSLAVLSGFLPSSVYQLILDITNNVLKSRSKAFISLGMIATVWSASAGILAFMYGMNKAYKRKETRPFWKVRGLSIVFTLALTLIILFSIVLVVFGEIIGRQLTSVLGYSREFELMWDVVRYIIAFGTLLLLFLLFYRFIPNYHLSIKDVVPGAVLSTIGWILLSAGFAFYVNNFSSFSKTYGSIGAVIALLIWLYWSSIIIFIGSEVNAILSKKHK